MKPISGQNPGMCSQVRAKKDEVESYLHDHVCSGVISLAEAQQQIAADWYAVYIRIHSDR